RPACTPNCTTGPDCGSPSRAPGTLPGTCRSGTRVVHQMGSRPSGTPNGIRTRAATLKGWCPRPLDDGGRSRREQFRLLLGVPVTDWRPLRHLPTRDREVRVAVQEAVGRSVEPLFRYDLPIEDDPIQRVLERRVPWVIHG